MRKDQREQRAKAARLDIPSREPWSAWGLRMSHRLWTG